MKCYLELFSAITAILAAIFWLISAFISIPPDIGIHNYFDYLLGNGESIFDINADYEDSEKGTPLGENQVISDRSSDKIKELLISLNRQGKYSGVAAFFAGLSAICQFCIWFLK